MVYLENNVYIQIQLSRGSIGKELPDMPSSVSHCICHRPSQLARVHSPQYLQQIYQQSLCQDLQQTFRPPFTDAGWFCRFPQTEPNHFWQTLIMLGSGGSVGDFSLQPGSGFGGSYSSSIPKKGLFLFFIYHPFFW